MSMAEFLGRDTVADRKSMQQYLRANLHPEPDPVEHLVKSVMAGDAGIEDHPAYLPPNPWMDKAGWNFARLKRMLEAGQVPDSSYEEAMRALVILADGSPFYGPGERPQEPPPDAPVGVYVAPRFEGTDTEVFDPSGQTFIPRFDATIIED